MNTQQALRDLLAAIDLRWPVGGTGQIDRAALDPSVEKAKEALAQFDTMTDGVKTAILHASLLNVGRLLPPGTEVYFYRDDGDPRTRMQICYSDGTNTEYAFVGHGPVFDVALAPSAGQPCCTAFAQADV